MATLVFPRKPTPPSQQQLAIVVFFVTLALLLLVGRAHADETCRTRCRTDSGGNLICKTVCK